MTVDFTKGKKASVGTENRPQKSVDFSKPIKVKIIDIIEKTAKTGRTGWTIWFSAGGHKHYETETFSIYFDALSLTIWFDETMENLVYYGSLSEILNTAEHKSTHLIEKLEEAFKQQIELGPVAAQRYYNVAKSKFYYGEPFVTGKDFKPLETIRTERYNPDEVVTSDEKTQEESCESDKEILPF